MEVFSETHSFCVIRVNDSYRGATSLSLPHFTTVYRWSLKRGIKFTLDLIMLKDGMNSETVWLYLIIRVMNTAHLPQPLLHTLKVCILYLKHFFCFPHYKNCVWQCFNHGDVLLIVNFEVKTTECSSMFMSCLSDLFSTIWFIKARVIGLGVLPHTLELEWI